MSLLQITPPPSQRRIPQARLIVHTKPRWSDGWSEQPFLDPLTARSAAGPTIGSATFSYRYGYFRQPGTTAKRTYEPLDMDRHYIQIQAGTPGYSTETLWTGVVAGDVLEIDGNDTVRVSGTQAISAWGIGKIFDRVSLSSAYMESGETFARLGRMPEFNASNRFGPRVLGNRSAGKQDIVGAGSGIASSYLFGGTDIWTNLGIVEYLLGWHPPEGHTFRLSGEYAMLDNIVEVQRLHGLTLNQALDHLIPRQRGMGWVLETTGAGTITLHVFSLLAESISIGNVILPGNSRIVDNIPVGNNRAIEKATIEGSSAKQVDRIEVVGKPIKVCCTLSYAEGTLEKAWTATEEAAYNQLPAMADTSEAEKNDEERQSAKHERVYQMHRVPRDWDWKAGNGTIGSTQFPVVPSVKLDGTLDVENPAATLTRGKAFLRHIPLLKSASASGAEPEYLAPLVFVPGATAGRWRQIDTGSLTETSTARVRMTDGELAVETLPSINHILAKNHFETDVLVKDSAQESALDYTDIVVTVATESDEPLRVVASLNRPQTGAPVETLTIPVEDAELYYIVPGTITGVSDGAFLRHGGGAVRDDSPVLRQVAALATAWYGQFRQVLNLTVKGIHESLPLGSYIRRVTTSDRQNVGTPVTEKSWNFQDKAQTTTIRTGYIEIDIAEMAGRVDFPGMSDKRAVVKAIKQMRGDIGDLRERTGNLDVRTPKASTGGGGVGGDTRVWWEGTY